MKAKINLDIVSIQGDGFHVFFYGKINDTSVRLLIDTGASKTVLDKAFVNTLKDTATHINDTPATGLGGSGIETEVANIAKFEIDNLILESIDMAVIDLSHVNQMYESIGIENINGVLGGDILMNYNAVIQYKKRSLKLSLKKSNKNKSTKPV